MKKLYLFFAVFTLQHLANAQTEFLVKVNPASGVHSIIDSLPGVNYIYVEATTYDKAGKRYFFRGIDFGGADHLYTVNAITGAIIYSPLCTLNLGELEFDNTTNKLYGIDANSLSTDLIEIDPVTATTVSAITLPFSGYGVGQDCYDETTHTYIIQNSGNLYSIDVTTGATVMVSAPQQYNEMKFDNTAGKAYALTFVSGVMQLVYVDLTTGGYTSICSLPSGYNSGIAAFDEINHHYTYNGIGNLISVDVNAGSIVSSPAFPVGITAPENIIELHYDNTTGILYALHWGTAPAGKPSAINEVQSQDVFCIYPNPAHESITIQFNKPFAQYSISVFNVYGQLVLKQDGNYSLSCKLKTEGFASGMYTVNVVCDGVSRGKQKLIFE